MKHSKVLNYDSYCHISSFFHTGTKRIINNEIKQKLLAIINDAANKFRVIIKNPNVSDVHFQMELYPENNENISVIIKYIKQERTDFWL
jgi:hypothetical protein